MTIHDSVENEKRRKKEIPHNLIARKTHCCLHVGIFPSEKKFTHFLFHGCSYVVNAILHSCIVSIFSLIPNPVNFWTVILSIPLEVPNSLLDIWWSVTPYVQTKQTSHFHCQGPSCLDCAHGQSGAPGCEVLLWPLVCGQSKQVHNLERNCTPHKDPHPPKVL